jgi:hypothetical protein
MFSKCSDLEIIIFITIFHVLDYFRSYAVEEHFERGNLLQTASFTRGTA